VTACANKKVGAYKAKADAGAKATSTTTTTAGVAHSTMRLVKKKMKHRRRGGA
jgi:hypothetical protein